MTILAADLKLYDAVVVDISESSTTNGGRMGTAQNISNVKNNVWPDVPQSERTAGSTKYRKLFHKAEDNDDTDLQNTKIHLTKPSTGDDRVFIFPGTQTDTQNDITGSERPYGAGQLDADISISAGGCVVNLETGAGADQPLRDGDLIWIGDGTNEEFLRLAGTGGVSYNADEVTLTFDSGVTTANAYVAATPTYVAAVIEAGTVTGTVNSVVESTVGDGTFDDLTPGNLAADHVGALYENITITMGAGDSFTCVGDTLGSLGSGSRSADFSPVNSAFSEPYFTLKAAGWTGTWADGDTLTFTLSPAAYPVWHKRIIPPGASALAGDEYETNFAGESA